jgi:hypothetical protein
MKRIYTILLGLLMASVAFGQTITEVYVPRYLRGDGTVSTADNTKVPFVCRLTLGSLTPNATYRYTTRFATATTSELSTGEGGSIFIRPSGFLRASSPSVSIADRYGEFTTDATGAYTGWFAGEAGTTSMFVAGSTIFVRIALNDGAGGNTALTFLTGNNPISVLNFGAAAGNGSALRSTPAASGAAKNFVLLFEDEAGAGRPIAGTYIESDGVDNNTTNGYANFYVNQVNTVDKAWGTIVPNTLPDGIRKIAQYSLTDGTETGSKTSADGSWAQDGGGTISTISPAGGLTSVIVLNGNIVTLGAGATKLDQTIIFNALATVTYGDADVNPGATASSTLPVTYTSSDPAVAAIVNGNTIQLKGAGTADITAMQAGDANFNAAPNIVQKLTVNKAALTIKAEDKNMVQGDPLPVLTASYTGFVNGENATVLNPQPDISTTATAASPAGGYPITVSGAGSPNYTITYEPGILTLTAAKQQQNIAFAALPAKIYGSADFATGATVNSGLTIAYSSSDPAVATVTNGIIHMLKAGTTNITASQAGDVNFEAATPVVQTLVVSKAPLIITADNKTKLLGQPVPALTISYNGFVLNETSTVFTAQPVISTTATATSPVGSYPVTVAGTIADNYTITHVNGTLTISPLPAQTITFAALPLKKYGDNAFMAGATASSGLPVNYSSSNAGVAIVAANGMITITGAGTTNITASQPGNADYAPAPDVVQVLTVQKAVLTIQADDKEKTEGQANPSFTATYSGFVKNENASVLNAQPVLAATATASSLPGEYAITVSGAAAANYSLLQLAGKLTVLPLQGRGQYTVSAWCSAPGQLQVNILADTSEKAVVQLFDPSGTRVLNASVRVNKGFNNFRFPIGNVTAGVYYLRVTGREFTVKEKVNIR